MKKYENTNFLPYMIIDKLKPSTLIKLALVNVIEATKVDVLSYFMAVGTLEKLSYSLLSEEEKQKLKEIEKDGLEKYSKGGKFDMNDFTLYCIFTSLEKLEILAKKVWEKSPVDFSDIYSADEEGE